MSDRLFRLLERHQQIDTELRSAQRRRWVDPFEIARLKKLKLALKDRLARIARRKPVTADPFRPIVLKAVGPGACLPAANRGTDTWNS